MINVLHLIWIAPLCVIIGMVILAFIFGATQESREYEAYLKGIEEGKKLGAKTNE